ncbi:MAG: hypothetical protein QOG50_417 [Actinomycetota bacterium]|nr:hypothetical protein [Actinomycetota bacterium]
MLVLAIIAFALIKSLMSVVAREEGTTVPPWRLDDASTSAGDLTVELRATANDDVRAFLLPAVPEPAGAEQPEVEQPDVEQPGISERTR